MTGSTASAAATRARSRSRLEVETITSAVLAMTTSPPATTSGVSGSPSTGQAIEAEITGEHCVMSAESHDSTCRCDQATSRCPAIPGSSATATSTVQSLGVGLAGGWPPRRSASGVTVRAAAIITLVMYSSAEASARARLEKSQYAVHDTVPASASRSPTGLHAGWPELPTATIATPRKDSAMSPISRRPGRSPNIRPATSVMRIGESAPMIAAFATVVSFTAVNPSEMSTANSAPPGAHARNVDHDSRRLVTASAIRCTSTPSHSRYIAKVTPVRVVDFTKTPTLPQTTVAAETAAIAAVRWWRRSGTAVAYGRATVPDEEGGPMQLQGKRVGVLLEEGFEDLEFWVTVMRLREEGADVKVVGTKAGKTVRGKHCLEATAEVAAAEVSADELDALVVPGGWAPDKLRRYPEITGLVRAVAERGKIVGLICHAGLVGISAGIVAGHRATGSLGIRDDLVNAGATWVDEPAFRDGNLVWGRVVEDIPAFCRELVRAIAEP